MMKMRTTKPEQLNLVFADSPQGGQAAEVPDLLGTAKVRVHLLSRDVPASKAATGAWSGRGIWPRSAQRGMHLGYRIDWFTEQLVSLTTEWYRHNLPILVPPVSERQLVLFAL